MKKIVILPVLVGVLYFVSVLFAEASIPIVYTNDNFFVAEQDAPKSFWRDGEGNFTGLTQTGKTFYQRSVVADMHVRLHRFTIDEASFYISSFGIIQAETDTVALSVYLAKAGWEVV